MHCPIKFILYCKVAIWSLIIHAKFQNSSFFNSEMGGNSKNIHQITGHPVPPANSPKTRWDDFATCLSKSKCRSRMNHRGIEHTTTIKYMAFFVALELILHSEETKWMQEIKCRFVFHDALSYLPLWSDSSLSYKIAACTNWYEQAGWCWIDAEKLFQ